MQPQAVSPFDSYLRRGVTLPEIRSLLDANACLEFPHVHSGMFPACNFADLDNDTTGMAHAWLRDTALVSYLLLLDGQIESAHRAVRALLDCLAKTASYYERIVTTGIAPGDDTIRPPVSFTGQSSEPRLAWGNDQNDAIGYTLLAIGAAVDRSDFAITDSDRSILQLLPDFLHIIAYWQDPDRGHWEEDVRINASSICAVIAGLQACEGLLQSSSLVAELINQGRGALNSILPNESIAPVERAYDAALLFAVEPLQILDGDMAAMIVANIEAHLVGQYGVRRYLGDSYWATDWRALQRSAQLSGDYSQFMDLSKRNKLHKPGSEAQWTLFDPLLCAYYANRYAIDPQTVYKDKAADYLRRSLRAIVSAPIGPDQRLAWRIPEAYYQEAGRWIPNDHLGLLWSQANLLYALRCMQPVLKDEPLKHV